MSCDSYSSRKLIGCDGDSHRTHHCRKGLARAFTFIKRQMEEQKGDGSRVVKLPLACDVEVLVLLPRACLYPLVSRKKCTNPCSCETIVCTIPVASAAWCDRQA